MPPSNVDVVRAVVGAFNRADFGTAMEMCTPDVEFDWSRRLLDGEIVQGRDNVRQFMEQAMEIFDEIRIDEEEMIDLGDEVLMVGNGRFKGRASGLDVEARAANLWAVRAGKVARFRFYQSKEDALADRLNEAS
jgi:ketosteroid isomerase-like protein